MLNGMTVLRFENMPELARSGGKKTAQCTHCALVTLVAFIQCAVVLPQSTKMKTCITAYTACESLL